MIEGILYLLFGIAVFFLVSTLVLREKEAQLAIVEKKGKSKSPLYQLFAPFIRRSMIKSVQLLSLSDFRKKSRRPIEAAGMQDEIDPDELFAYKLLLTLILPAIGLIYNFSFKLGHPWLIFVVLAIVGFYYPDLWIRSRAKERQRHIQLALPFVIDFLALATEAGLDFLSAVKRVIEKSKPNPLIEELDRFLKETSLGMSRADALREMARRTDMTSLSSFAAVVVTAFQTGGSINQVLKAQSDQIRHERFIRAEKAGAAASQKILFPLVIFILPAIFLIVLGPLIIRFLTRGG